MFMQSNIFIHHRKSQVTSVIFTGTDGIEQFVIFIYNIFSAFGIPENPFFELRTDCIGFSLYHTGCINIDNTLFLCIAHTIGNFNGFVNFRVFQVQHMLHDFISVHFRRTEFLCGKHRFVRTFAVYMPCTCMFGIFAGNRAVFIPASRRTVSLLICWSLEQFINKLLIIFRVNPSCADFHINIACFQRFGHSLFQSIDIDIEIAVIFCNFFGNIEFLSDIARKILTRCLICIFGMRNFENLSCQVVF